MTDPIDPTGLSKAAVSSGKKMFKAVQRERARRGAADKELVDFTSLKGEIEEALDVLAGDAETPIKEIYRRAKAKLSDRPALFNEEAGKQWIRTQKTQELVARAFERKSRGQDYEAEATEAASHYESIAQTENDPNAHAAFEHALNFVSLSVFRDMDVGDRMTQAAISGLKPKFDRLEHLVEVIRSPDVPASTRELVGNEVSLALTSLRQKRPFVASDVLDAQVNALADRLVDGDLALANDQKRAAALAMCARWLAHSGKTDRSETLLKLADQLCPGTEEARIAAAFLEGKADWQRGLARLQPIDTPQRRTAALQIVHSVQDAAASIQWAADAGIELASLDATGKFVLLHAHGAAGNLERVLESLPTLSESDYEEVPALFHVAAMAKLQSVVSEDLRPYVMNGVPIGPDNFPLHDDPPSLDARREASSFFTRLDEATAKLGLEEVASARRQYALWLKLRDDEMQAAARERLTEQLSGSRAIDYLPLALSFGVAVDFPAVERELKSRATLNPDGSPEDALARLYLALRLADPSNVADELEAHHNLLFKYLAPGAVLQFEIQALLAAGRSEEARGRLDRARDRLKPGELEKLEVVLGDGAEGPSVEDLETRYAQDKSTSTLGMLVEKLSLQGCSARFIELSRELVVRTRSREDAVRISHHILRHKKFAELKEMLDDIEDLIERSPELMAARAWSDYSLGRINQASEMLDQLSSLRDEPGDRALYTNIAIASGRWLELHAFLEKEWAKREGREVGELLSLAAMGSNLGSSRARDLAEYVAQHSKDKPNLLLGAYTLATESGWEENDLVHGWFEAAHEQSGPDGPLQSMPLEELLAGRGDWERHVENVWEKLRKGELPMSVAAKALRKASLELQLIPMLYNRREADPRRRSVIPAYSGVRGAVSVETKRIALDGSALVTLSLVGALDPVLQHCAPVLIPHTTLAWLFNERRRLSFHQPSRIKSAHHLKDALASKRLHPFPGTASADPMLVETVGQPLASMLSAARAATAADSPAVVIRPYPVPKIGDLSGTPLDMTDYGNLLFSCEALVDLLASRGILTSEEEQKARDYLAHREERWPHEKPIPDEAQIYLDDLAVDYLRHLGVLERLHEASLTAFISEREIGEADALLTLERLGEETKGAIDGLRATLEAAIAAGRVELGPLPESEEDHLIEPNVAILKLAPNVDAVVSDDRFLNQHAAVNEDGGQAALLTSLDLLGRLSAAGVLNEAKLTSIKAQLRRHGYMLIPVTGEELINMLERARIVDGKLQETAELRSFRENMQLVQLRGWLHLPKEAAWLQQLTEALCEAIAAQWNESIPDEVARARSSWLMDRGDARDWASAFAAGDGSAMAVVGAAMPFNSLLLRRGGDWSGTDGQRLAAWLETVAARLKHDDPAGYDSLLGFLRGTVLGASGGES